MRRSAWALSLVCFLGIARAENLNLNETAETTSVSLSPYSLGFGTGVLMPVSQELADRDPAFLKLSLVQSLRFQEHLELGMDLDVWLPGKNFGGAVNIDFLFGKGAFRPFVGMGLGMQYVDHTTYRFGDNFGLQGIAQLGLLFDVMDELQLRLRVPFHLVANKDFDEVAGLDFALLFSSPHRKTRVKKLQY